MERLIEILKELAPEIDYETQTNLVTARVFDSFDVVMLAHEIYEKFGVQIPPEDIIPQNFDSAKALYALILRLQPGA